VFKENQGLSRAFKRICILLMANESFSDEGPVSSMFTQPTDFTLGPFKVGLIQPLIWLLIAISQPWQSNTNK
jgi:hypothetical protein